MFEKKKLVVNCDICDARNISEENYNGYEEILINADCLIVNEKSKAVLSRLPLTCNIDKTLETEDEVELQIINMNGNYKISGAESSGEKIVLNVNGNLEIEAGTGERMKDFIAVNVNGSIRYPDSMVPFVQDISVNGGTLVYPDDCIVLSSEFTLDKYFPLRAGKEARYFAASKVILSDPEVNAAPLVEKRVRFVTPKLLVREEKLEEVIPLFDESAVLEVIPTGFGFLQGDIVWNDKLISRYGNKLYVDRNLTINEHGAAGLEQLEKLIVKGEARILKKYQEALDRINAEYCELVIVKGKTLENKVNVTVNRSMLESCEDGIRIRNCAFVQISEDMEVQSILDQLILENCACVRCTPEQKSAVELVGRNVAVIRTEDGDGILGEMKKWKDTKAVNADQYVL